MKSWLPHTYVAQMVIQAIKSVFLKRACFLVAYFSIMVWLVILYGKRLGLPEIYRAYNYWVGSWHHFLQVLILSVRTWSCMLQISNFQDMAMVYSEQGYTIFLDFLEDLNSISRNSKVRNSIEMKSKARKNKKKNAKEDHKNNAQPCTFFQGCPN